ncbi:hypothetical protein BST12_06675 [Mycobacterium angelicum]|uniref:Uncharacterized protein n=1 Tax=Mycobacterium angelicum TaxID=470074 RepID=A0A1X0A1T0_MYCAN|nr:hypothetical protein BST12_06675 [Mycobacterium angelicum]
MHRGAAGIVGFRRFGILPESTKTFAFWGECEVLPYESWKDFAATFDEIVDGENIDISTRMYWPPDQDLEERWRSARAKIGRTSLGNWAANNVYIGGIRYGIREIR